MEAPPPLGEGNKKSPSAGKNSYKVHLRQWIAAKGGDNHVAWWLYDSGGQLIYGPEYGPEIYGRSAYDNGPLQISGSGFPPIDITITNATDRWTTTIMMNYTSDPKENPKKLNHPFGDGPVEGQNGCGPDHGLHVADNRGSWYHNEDGSWQRDFDCILKAACTFDQVNAGKAGVLNSCDN